MNKVIINYLLKNFLKTFLVIVLIFFCFGVILNLFEEIEFFKNLNVSIFLPLMLTSIFIPSMIIKILPFIIFISSMWFMLRIRNNKDLLTLKMFGYSNIKIFFILASVSFILGWFVLIFANPITSAMAKYYEKTKANYSKDIASRDTKGSISNYKLLANATFNIEVNGKRDSVSFKEDFIMKNLEDNFEKNNYEKTIKKNFSNSITDKLMIQIFSIK